MESCKVYTPPELAKGIVHMLGDEADASWLEPSFGKGVFVKAISDLGVPRERLVAIDLDTEAQKEDCHATAERGIDFLEWSMSTTMRFDRIVGNPPYIPYSQLPNSIKKATSLVSVPNIDSRPNGSSNLWFYFLCASLELLREGGSLAFVLPAAWEYADYAQPLRDGLLRCFRSVSSIRSRSPLFSGVQEGSVVLVCNGYQLEPQTIDRIICDDLDEVIQTLASLREKPSRAAPTPTTVSERHKRLSDFLHIQIGAVTGHSSYFLMNESRRRELSLPRAAMRPILSKSKHLEESEVTQEVWSELRDADERVWIFRPPPRLVGHSAVSAYLEKEVDAGGCNKEAKHVARRKKWYRTDMPENVHGFISGMSSIGPWVALNQMKGLNASNTLYTVTFDRSLSLSDRYAVALAMLSTESRRQLDERCRLYPDGLRKHEPKDILAIRVLLPTHRRGVIGKYREATRQLLQGNEIQASEIADRFIAAS